MNAAGKSASFGPVHGLLSATNADHHCKLLHRSSLGDFDCSNCRLIIACGGIATVIDYFFRDSHRCSMVVAVDDKKKA